MNDAITNPSAFYQGEPPGEWQSRDVRDRAADQILHTLIRSAEHFDPLRQGWDEFFNIYSNKRTNLKQSNRLRSNVPSGLGSEIVDTFHADIMTKLFRTRPLVIQRGREGSDKKASRAVEELVQYNFDMMPAFERVDPAILSAEIFGSGPAKVFWEQRTVNIPVPGQKDPAGGPMFEPALSYRGANISPTFVYDVYPDPNKVHINDRYPIADVSWGDFSDLRKLEKAGVYSDVDDILSIDEMRKHTRWKNLVTVFGDRYYRSEQRASLGWSGDSRLRPDGVFLIEWEGFFRPEIDWVDAAGRNHKGSEPIRSILVMANGVVIRAEPSPFASGENAWIWAKISNVPGQLYGMGLIQKAKPQIHVTDVALNMALQNLAQTVNRPKIVREDLIHSAMTYDDSPGAVIRAKPNAANLDQVMREVATQSLGNDVWRMISHSTERAEGVSGANALKMGRLPDSEQTATASNTAFSQASQKFEYAMLWIDHSFILPASNKVYALNQQFLDIEAVKRLLGATGAYFPQVTPQDLAMAPDFIPLASTKTATTQLAISEYQQAIRVISGINAPWVEPVQRKIVMELFAEWRWQNLDELEELMDLRNQQAEQMGMIPGMEAPGGNGDGRAAAPTGTGRQDRRTGDARSLQGLAKQMGGKLSNQARG